MRCGTCSTLVGRSLKVVVTLYLKALLKKPRGIAEGETIPRIERHRRASKPDAKRIAAFHKLCEFAPSPYLPFTYPYAASFIDQMANLVDPRFPLPLMGTIHRRTVITQTRPILATEALHYVSFIDGNRRTAKGVEYDLETEAYVGDELVWRSVATMLSRIREAGMKRTRKPEQDQAAEALLRGAAEQHWSISTTVGPGFAKLSGDYNPIHLASFTARLLGQPAMLAHGMYSLSRVAAALGDACHAPYVKLSGDFKLPLYLPASVLYRSALSRPDTWAFALLDDAGLAPYLLGTLET